LPANQVQYHKLLFNPSLQLAISHQLSLQLLAMLHLLNAKKPKAKAKSFEKIYK
jgi:hypothetical protein